MLDETWLPDIRCELSDDDIKCKKHMEEGTFDEEDFTYLFIHWKQYGEASNDYYRKHGEHCKVNYCDDIRIPEYASYYNDHTLTNNRYDDIGRIYQIESPKTFSYEEKETIVTVLKGVGLIILGILLLRSCARAEGEDVKKVLDKMKKEGIEFQDQNFIPYNISTEVIRPEDYPVRTLK